MIVFPIYWMAKKCEVACLIAGTFKVLEMKLRGFC